MNTKLYIAWDGTICLSRQEVIDYNASSRN